MWTKGRMRRREIEDKARQDCVAGSHHITIYMGKILSVWETILYSNQGEICLKQIS